MLAIERLDRPVIRERNPSLTALGGREEHGQRQGQHSDSRKDVQRSSTEGRNLQTLTAAAGYGRRRAVLIQSSFGNHLWTHGAPYLIMSAW